MIMEVNQEIKNPLEIERLCKCGKVVRVQCQDGVDRDIVAALRKFLRFVECPECTARAVAAVRGKGKQRPGVRLPYRDD